MFAHLIEGLRQAGLPTSITEYLTLLGAMKAGVAEWSIEDFYYLARATLVKDERHLDKFDRVFAQCFKGLEPPEGIKVEDLPEEWLRKLAEKLLSPEEMAKIQALGGFEALMQRLAELLAEQKERHQGGSRWIGTAGTSPFGAYGYNPEGVRIGQRKFARQGAATELDLPDTIRSTAKNAGTLDLKLVPERHNAVKVLLFLDVGGSMDDFVKLSEELFSAARSEFKHLEYFYFHNFPYERVWRNNRRRHDERISTFEVIRKYGPDYKLIFVGDAAMSPYEITMPGGSVEHMNEEAGKVWLERLTSHYRRSAWLNPTPRNTWQHV